MLKLAIIRAGKMVVSVVCKNAVSSPVFSSRVSISAYSQDIAGVFRCMSQLVRLRCLFPAAFHRFTAFNLFTVVCRASGRNGTGFDWQAVLLVL